MSAPSAKGLFRATGNMSTDTAPREEHDFYPTPPDVTRAFLAVEGDRIRRLGGVWEPACGDGAMAREIEAYGLPCIATDLIDRGYDKGHVASFYSYGLTLAPAIVTNPPYCEVNARDGQGRWLSHSMAIGAEYVALFLNWDWPCARGLAGLLERYPVSRVYACRWKVDFTGKGAPPQRNAWFVWDKSWRGETALRFIDREQDGRQFDLLSWDISPEEAA